MSQSNVRAAVNEAISHYLLERRSAILPNEKTPKLSIRGRLDHPSHLRFPKVAILGDPGSNRCIIQPDVDCVHCKYCQSHGY